MVISSTKLLRLTIGLLIYAPPAPDHGKRCLEENLDTQPKGKIIAGAEIVICIEMHRLIATAGNLPLTACALRHSEALALPRFAAVDQPRHFMPGTHRAHIPLRTFINWGSTSKLERRRNWSTEIQFGVSYGSSIMVEFLISSAS